MIQGCDRFKKNKEVKHVQVPQRQEEIVKPAPIPAAAAPVVIQKKVVKKEQTKKVTTTKKPVEKVVPPLIYEEEILIQAQEAPRPKNEGKTFNELQRSEHVDDYPFVPSTDQPNFNDLQRSR